MSKKTVLALAALAVVAGTAHAQSSVTVYGIIDQAVRKTNDGTSALTFFPGSLFGAANAWTVAQATSSRLGFKGTEDLGGGLKANFLIEHRFMPDTGGIEPRDNNITGGFWNAASWVGLSSASVGEVRLGRQYVPAFYVALAADPFGYDYSVAGMASFTRGGNGVTTAYNAVTYTSPNMGGLTAQVIVAAGEGAANGAAVNAPAGSGRNVGASLVYAAGPLYAGLAWNDTDRPSDSFKNTYWTLNVAYDFGFIRPNVSISQGRNPYGATSAPTAAVIGDAKTKTYLLGATMPMGNGRIKAAIGRHDAGVGQFFTPLTSTAFNNGANTTKVALGYEYSFSKRTLVRADVATAKTENRTRAQGYEVGIKHSF